MPSTLDPMRFAERSLTTKLATIGLLMALSLLAVYGVAVRTIPSQVELSTESMKLSEAQRLNQHADMLHDSLHADLLRTLLNRQEQLPALERDPSKVLAHDIEAFKRDLSGLQQLQLPKELADLTAQTVAAGRRYVARVEQIHGLSLTNRQAAINALPEFDAAFAAAEVQMSEFTERLATFIQKTHGLAVGQYEQARQWVTYAGLLAIVIGWAGVAAISRSIRRSLRGLCVVARDIAAGQLDRRSHRQGSDEIGQLSASIDCMAESLEKMIDRVKREAELAAFGGTLARALDMSSDEADTCRIVAEAMELAAPQGPTELLLVDSNTQRLARAATHPSAGAPGCGVESVHDCVAMRRAQPMAFPDSRAIDACPRIRARDGEPVCASCIPVTFTGQAVGVLHTTSTISAPLPEASMNRLSTLARQAGGRIGSLRALLHSEMQARTDALTGLPNRRSTEAWIRDALRQQVPFSLLVCDIDHFKSLNDAHGHQAGDEALKCFARVAQRLAGASDLVGRWGGDEFVCLLSGRDRAAAAEWAAQLQRALAMSLLTHGTPTFTISLGLAESRSSAEMDALLRLADKALYRAKATGRNRAETMGGTEDLGHGPPHPHTPAPVGLKVVATP